MRTFDRHVKQPITVCFVQHHVSGRGNVAQCFPHIDFTWAARPSIFGDTFLFLLLLLSSYTAEQQHIQLAVMQQTRQ